jgi:hypothetical protein
MAEVFIGQVLQGNVFWTLACSGLLAIPEYVRWGKAGPPSKSAWFWMAREHDHSTPPHTSQSTETYISTLLQKASDVTITVPTTITTTKKDVTTVTTTQKEPTTTVKGAGSPLPSQLPRTSSSNLSTPPGECRRRLPRRLALRTSPPPRSRSSGLSPYTERTRKHSTKLPAPVL